MRNLRRKALVVHQQQLELANVVHQELLQSIGQKVASLLVGAVPDLFHSPLQQPELVELDVGRETYLGHWQLALEPPAHPVINTLWLPPCLLYRVVAVRLVAPVSVARVRTSVGRSDGGEVRT